MLNLANIAPRARAGMVLTVVPDVAGHDELKIVVVQHAYHWPTQLLSAITENRGR
jgi:hypothetical protein